jgi:hypothetical protein
MADLMGFKVITERLTDGWRVTVSTDDRENAAEITAPDVDTALKMAVPYMAVLSEPDPLEALFRRDTAPDGPPDAG